MPRSVTADARRCRLAELLRRKSFLHGEFVLASGARSSYYFDSKLTTLDPEGAYLTGHVVVDALAEWNIQADAIGGLTLGADPIVAAVAAASFEQGRPLAAFIVRKEPKQHGARRYLEGYDGSAGRRAVIVDDVCTTAESTMKAITAAKESGFEIIAVICLVDREQGGSARLAAEHPFYAIFTAKELMGESGESASAG